MNSFHVLKEFKAIGSIAFAINVMLNSSCMKSIADGNLNAMILNRLSRLGKGTFAYLNESCCDVLLRSPLF
jgi:hypothetical protein